MSGIVFCKKLKTNTTNKGDKDMRNKFCSKVLNEFNLKRKQHRHISENKLSSFFQRMQLIKEAVHFKFEKTISQQLMLKKFQI